MKKVLIVNTRGIYGGNLMLSLLCKLLRQSGVDAKMFYIYNWPDYTTNLFKYWVHWVISVVNYHILSVFYKVLKNTKFGGCGIFRRYHYIPIKGVKEKYLPFFNKKDTIIIYPEVMSGNFLNGELIVRWLLYYNRWKNDYKAFGINDLIICYREIFNDWDLNPNGLKLTLNFFDADMYKQYNFGERSGVCYLIRKGRNRKDLPVEYGGPIIDFGMRECEIVRIFNSYKYCYCYDTQTFYTSVAAVCGCIPIVVMEDGKSKEDYLSKDDPLPYGIAYGDSFEEIEWAKQTRNLLVKKLDFTLANMKNVQDFISILEARFN